MLKEDRARRRALIVRRWAAYRAGQAQREIWSRRCEEQVDDLDAIAADADVLAELPDTLIG